MTNWDILEQIEAEHIVEVAALRARLRRAGACNECGHSMEKHISPGCVVKNQDRRDWHEFCTCTRPGNAEGW